MCTEFRCFILIVEWFQLARIGSFARWRNISLGSINTVPLVTEIYRIVTKTSFKPNEKMRCFFGIVHIWPWLAAVREKRTIDCEGEELEIVEHLLPDLGSRGLRYKICEVSQYHNYHKHFLCTTPPGGVLPYKGLMGTCGQPGYVFRDFCLKQGIEFIIFCLNQGIDLSIFVLNRMSFLGR